MGTGVGEAALLQAIGVGAATGAATSAVTGGDPLKGALFGAVGGGATSALGGALAGGTSGATAGSVAGANAANTLATAAQEQVLAQGGSQLAADNAFRQTFMDQVTPVVTSGGGGGGLPSTGDLLTRDTESTKNVGSALGNLINKYPVGAPAVGGIYANVVGNRPNMSIPGEEQYTGPLSKFSYDPKRYKPAFAEGGIAALPASRMFAGGGHLGGYSDGGRLLKGPGDGMSDSIPAKIGQRQPARLADGEFVVPADVVSHLGNGSTDAGAKQLYAMMDKVRQARTGKKQQAKAINPRKVIPA